MSDSFWDSEEEIKDIAIRGRENHLIIKRVEKNGTGYVDIRKFYTNDEGEPAPTRKGLSIPLEYIDDVIDALKEVKK
ncbi:MAG: transcriptional coactivator p15/PC4 family protein [Clostridiales bacterium]|nr:transcriptional coactivator p15/PC4 family protein [Clostridiales bacterium]